MRKKILIIGALFMNYLRYNGENSNDLISSQYKYSETGIGLAIGFKWVFQNKLLIDIAGGYAVNFMGGYQYDKPDYIYDYVKPAPFSRLLKFSVGYRF